jgi:hypothetical protein
MTSDQKKAAGCGVGCLMLIVLIGAVSLTNGYRTGWDGNLDPGDPGYHKPQVRASAGATNPVEAVATPTPTKSKVREMKSATFDPRPHTGKEKEFHAQLLSEIGTPAQLKDLGQPLDQIKADTPNVYWGTMSYVGLRIEGDEVHVAIKKWKSIPRDVLSDLPRWYGNMAGDTWAVRDYTWILVDFKTGETVS